MKNILLTIILGIASIGTYATEIQINFLATGASTLLDSVTVENQTNGKHVTISGSDLLLLSTTTLLNEELTYNTINVYPNPVEELGNISFFAPKSGQICIIITSEV